MTKEKCAIYAVWPDLTLPLEEAENRIESGTLDKTHVSMAVFLNPTQAANLTHDEIWDALRRGRRIPGGLHPRNCN